MRDCICPSCCTLPLALAALATRVTASGAAAPVSLNISTFDDYVISSGKPTLVNFFVPWCGFCQDLEPVYDELVGAFAHTEGTVQIARVDAGKERDLRDRFQISAFPSIHYFDGVSDKPEEYDWGRDIDSLTAFLTEKTGLKPQLEKRDKEQSEVVRYTDKDFDDAVGGSKAVIVSFNAPWCSPAWHIDCKALAPTWAKLAADYSNERNIIIAAVEATAYASRKVAKEQDIQHYPTIRWFPPGGGETEDYTGGRSEDELVAWVNQKSGAHRIHGGGLDEEAGTVAALDGLVMTLGSGTSISEVFAKAKEYAATVEDDTGAANSRYYIEVLWTLRKNRKFAIRELSRLRAKLAAGGLPPLQRDEVQKRANVLAKFPTSLPDMPVPRSGMDSGKNEL